CALSEKLYHDLNIKMVPLTIRLDGKEYKDGKNISPTTEYNAMKNKKKTTTSQVSQQSFKDIITCYAETNQPLIYLAFSSGLSSTYQTAKMVEQNIKEQYPEAPLYVVDTKCASIGYGLVVRRAAQLAQQGAGIEEILETATYHA